MDDLVISRIRTNAAIGAAAGTDAPCVFRTAI